MTRKRWIIIIILCCLGLVLQVVFYFIEKNETAKCNDYTADYTKRLHPYFTPEYCGKFEYDIDNKIDKDYLIQVFLPFFIKGKVLNKYIDECNHSIKMIDIEIDEYYINIEPVQLFNVTDSIYYEIQKGDSIFKNSNSLIISVKRDSMTRNFKVSPYPQYWTDPYYQSNVDRLK